MFLVKCVPIVGTAVTASEAIGALINGDGKTFLAKTAQTFISGALDSALILSAGTSSLVTSPLKAGLLEGGKIAGKKAIEKVVVQEAGKITTNIAARAVSDFVAKKASGDGGRGGSRRGTTSKSNGSQSQSAANTNASSSGNDPPRDPRLPREHEIDDDYNDYDESVEPDVSNPIIGVDLGDIGRVEQLWAQIRFHHLRDGPRRGRGYTSNVQRFVDRLGRIRGVPKVRESDEVGHIVGDLLGGPNDRTYNFFPQSPYSNMEYYHTLERRIYDYLVSQNQAGNGHTAYVDFYAELVYVDYADWPPNRPRQLRIQVVYSDGHEEDFEFSNA